MIASDEIRKDSVTEPRVGDLEGNLGVDDEDHLRRNAGWPVLLATRRSVIVV